MKRQEYILKIDKPCEQEWNSMMPDGKGKYCSHCSKTVIDFTNLTDNQVVQFIENTSGKFCGRLSNAQLNRILETSQNSNYSYLYKILTGLLLLGGAKNIDAQSNINTDIEISTLLDNKEFKEQNEVNIETLPDSSMNYIEGVVLDSATKKPLDYVTIRLKGAKTNVSTDENGRFKIFVLEYILASGNLTLVVTYIGYEKAEFTINATKLPITTELLLNSQETELMGEVIIIKKKK